MTVCLASSHVPAPVAEHCLGVPPTKTLLVLLAILEGELAEYLKISKSTLYQMAQNGAIPASKIGKRWRFHKATIEEWLLRHPHWMPPEQEAEQ